MRKLKCTVRRRPRFSGKIYINTKKYSVAVQLDTFKCINCHESKPLTSKHFKIGKYVYLCDKCATKVGEVR